ncbi:MAG TPA: DUF3455 domain-containing protein [Terriglobales bacterium]|nr:DUF3455 domain-containing protein [Terriglobales bacterium]
MSTFLLISPTRLVVLFCFASGRDATIRCMTRALLPIAAMFAIIVQASGQGSSSSSPDVPDKLKAPAGENLILKAQGSGSQIYVCKQQADNKFAWTLKAPEAELRDDQGKVIGHHYAGPAWKHADDSEVTGKAIARVDSPNSDSIPWLLVSAVGHSGNGVFTPVTTIQRINTKGGQPPAATECDVSRKNTEVKSSYTADYYFYAPAK